MDECASYSQNKRALRAAFGIDESVIETVRGPLLVLDADFRVEAANRSFYRTFHVTREETEGQPLFELGNGQWDIPELRRLLHDVLPEESSVDDFEVDHHFASIGHRYMRLNARRICREGHSAELILLAIDDDTERRRIEEERRELETRFTSLVKNIKDHSIFTLDPTGCITSWNLEAERILGYAESDVLGKHFSIIFTAEDIEQSVPQQELDGAKEAGRAEDERWHRRKSGELFWALGIVTPTTDSEGRHTGYSKILRDMTESRRTHEALLRQSQQLRTLWDSAEVLLTAPDPQVMMQEIFHRVSEDLAVDAYFNFVVDESGSFLRLVAFGGVPEDLAASASRLEFGQTICGTVVLQRTPLIVNEVQQSDDVKTSLIKAFGFRTYICHPLIFEDQIIGTLSFASRRLDRFDDEELAFLKTLSHYVTVAYVRLRLVDELRTAHQRKDEFLAMLAHELRNPLAPIRSGLDVLAMEETEHSKTVKMMQAQVTHVVRLVDDLLDISRIMRERVDLRKQPVEISALIEQSVEAVRPSVDSHQQELVVRDSTEPLYIDADSVRVVQVIENLLNNASKYTSVGGRIELTVEQRDAMASITVRDNGVGIDRELLPNIFELFTQSDRSLDRAQGGLGIGLTLVKRLVELHGGTVSAESEGPGCGSTFIVQFPLVDAVEKTSDATEPLPAAEGRRIVVVDDNKGAAWMLSMLLKKLGDHEIESAHDGSSALAKIREHKPEIVLLDIGLPGMDGYEIARTLRESPEFDDVLLIALTGYGQEEDRRKSREAGFDEHLTKPPSVDQMKAVLAHPKLSKVTP